MVSPHGPPGRAPGRGATWCVFKLPGGSRLLQPLLCACETGSHLETTGLPRKASSSLQDVSVSALSEEGFALISSCTNEMYGFRQLLHQRTKHEHGRSLARSAPSQHDSGRGSREPHQLPFSRWATCLHGELAAPLENEKMPQTQPRTVRPTPSDPDTPCWSWPCQARRCPKQSIAPPHKEPAPEAGMGTSRPERGDPGKRDAQGKQPDTEGHAWQDPHI